MSDDRKMFLCVRSSKFSMKITPQTAAGWRAFGYWMLAFFVLTGLMVWGTVALEAKGFGGDQIAWRVVVPYVIATLAWTVSMVRWMCARSDIIDLADIAAWKREREAAARRGRR